MAELEKCAAHAWKEGRFAKSVLPVSDFNGTLCLGRDEHMRPGSHFVLGKLKPAFEGVAIKMGFGETVKQRYPQVSKLSHVHTAGKFLRRRRRRFRHADRFAGASQPARSEAARKNRQLRNGRMRSVRDADSARRSDTEGLARAGLGFDDVDLFEVNEAFASVVLYFMEQTGVSHDRINVNGGSIAMGHPIGATGAILIGTLVDELERTGAKRGVVTLCVGLGMGVATLIERV